MFLIALYCVFHYGRNIPLAEDWNLVGPLTDNESNFGAWLWQQNNEHRIPLPKICLLGVLKITNGDFRAGMVLTIFALAFLSAFLIGIFRKIRGGRSSYADAIFPIVFLHLGNWENLFWSWEFTFVLATILSCIVIGTVIRHTNKMTLKDAVIASLCMMGLPLCGANGLLYLLPVIPFLCLEAMLHFRKEISPRDRLAGVVLLVSVIITLLLVTAYLYGYVSPPWYAPKSTVINTIVTSIKFMALAFGPAADISWGFFGFLIIIIVVGTAALLLGRIFRVKWTEARTAIALLLFLGGSCLFAVALGYGRAALVPTVGLPMRYALLAAPSLIISYSAWELYSKNPIRQIVQWGLFLVMLFLLYPNTQKGFSWRNWYVKGTNKVLHDIQEGVPRSELAARHQEFLLHWDKNMLLESMEQLKQAKMGPFQFMREDPITLDQ